MPNSALLNILEAIAIGTAASTTLSLLLAAPLLLLKRYRGAKQVILSIAGVLGVGSVIVFGLSQIESYPIGSARLFLGAIWLAVLAVGPLMLGIGMGVAARRASARGQSRPEKINE